MTNLNYTDYQLDVARELLTNYFAEQIVNMDSENLVKLFELTHGDEYFENQD